jgi:flagellar biosynthesis anti-sigma factor FlgM
MKIEVNSAVASQPLADRTTNKVSSAGTLGTFGPTEDRTTFQSDRSSVQSLTSLALNSPDIRYARVDALHQAVNTGQYPIDAGRIAHAILNQ